MKMETPEDVLADSVHQVVDAESLKAWAEGPLYTVLPHRAMLCGQWIAHSGGYAAIQTWSFGVPPAYLATIECPGGNARSPIMSAFYQRRRTAPSFPTPAPSLTHAERAIVELLVQRGRGSCVTDKFRIHRSVGRSVCLSLVDRKFFISFDDLSAILVNLLGHSSPGGLWAGK
jgi:hypothetical protein